MSRKNFPTRSTWKTTAVRAVVLTACANGLYTSNALAAPVSYCGPTVSLDMITQCVLQAGAATDMQINSGATISNGSGAAVLFNGDLGQYGIGGSVGSLTNTGIIISQGLGVGDFNSVNGVNGILIQGELLGTLSNSGQIKAIATNPNGDVQAAAISEYGTPAMKGTLNNWGLISASATASGSHQGTAVGFYIWNAVATSAVINNHGTIAASVTGDSNSGAASAGIAAPTFSGVINNYGTISGTINTAQPLIAASFYSLDGVGTINNFAGGSMVGSLLAGGTIAINNSGTIDLPLNGGIFGGGFVGGNYTQSSTGLLRIAAKSNDPMEGYSRLNVQGTATVDGKAAVDVQSVNTLAIGQKLEKVVLAGTLTGNFSSVTDNSSMFNFRSLATTGANGYIDLEVIKGLTAVQSVTATNNSPSRGAASAIDTIVDGGTSNAGMQSVLDTLGKLQTEQQVSNAVSQVLPLLTGGSTAAVQGALGGISRVVQARIENNRGLSSGDVFTGDKQVWLKPFGSLAEQDNRNGVAGYKADTSGLIFGVDGTLSEDMRVGGAFGYAQSDINGKSSVATQRAKVDVYQLLGYGSYSLDEHTEINFQAGYGQNTNKGSRQIAFTGNTASSEYISDAAQLGVGIGRTYYMNSQTTVTPSIRADYSWIRDKAYSESGAGALNLNVEGHTTEAFVIGLDTKLARQVDEQTTLAANIGLGYDTINSKSAITSAFAGAPAATFVTYGINPDPWLVRGGFGAVYKLRNSVELNARYDFEYRESFLNQTASMKVRWSF